jgi:hypothetical protein
MPVTILTMGGASSKDIDEVVQNCAVQVGLSPLLGKDWFMDFGSEMVIGTKDAEKINKLICRIAPKNKNRALFVAGKSSGAVLAWNTFRLFYKKKGFADKYSRFVLMLVDPHGAVLKDGEIGPYCKLQDLGWPKSFSKSTNSFRVYNIYQQQAPEIVKRSLQNAVKRLTGASFPEAFENVEIKDKKTHHMTITRNSLTKNMIREALKFAIKGQLPDT